MITQQQASQILNNILSQGIDSLNINELISLLEYADDQYFNEEQSFIPDDQYDNIRRFAQTLEPTNQYFIGIGSEVRGGKVKLPYQMGSLDQKYENDIEDWIKNNSITTRLISSDKLDGASALVVYNAGKFQIGYSRGNGFEGADISRHLKQMPSLPKRINLQNNITIRGENIISIENFQHIQKLITTKAGKEYKNPRNCVSGIMNSENIAIEAYEYIDFVAYEIVDTDLSKIEQLEVLKVLGFKVVEYGTVEPMQIKGTDLTNLIKHRKLKSIYEIDGIVIDVDDSNKRRQMNPTRDTLNPAYSVKFKITDESNAVVATVADIDINISKHGYLKPRVQVEPIDLMGVTITYATGFNMRFIVDNKIQPGSKVLLVRSGDVIPYIIRVVEESPNVDNFTWWFQEKIDAIGEADWNETKIDLVIKDIDNNDTVRFEQLNAFFDSLGVEHLGEGNLKRMFDLGLELPELIIELPQEDLAHAIGSKVIAKKVYKSIRDKLTNIPLYKLMGAHSAFGRGLGVRKFKALWEAFEGDMTKCANEQAITQVTGFDSKTAAKIVKGYPIFCEFFDYLSNYVTIQEYVKPKEGNLTGKVIVFTGFRNATLEKQVENAGGKMGSSVSSKTNFVVTVNPNGSSGKLDKARDLNIPIVSIEELTSML